MAQVRQSERFNAAALYVEGVGWIGTTTEGELPGIEFIQADQKGGFYEAELSTGMLKPMTFKAKCSEVQNAMYEALSKQVGETANMYIRYNAARTGGSQARVATFRGNIKKLDFPKIEYGKSAELSFELTVQFFKLEEGSSTPILIDLDSITCEINGKDLWADMRNAIL